MSSIALLDTGVIVIFYCGTPEPKLVQLMERIKSGTIGGILMRTTLVEALSQLCKQPGGVTFAESTMASFLKNYNIRVQDFDSNVAFKAGKLKCQHRKKLSNVDCVAIAYALNNNIPFHTTEKELHKVIPKLKLETYSF
ncbi:MAG TPA: PIN domain-containing protein [Candidatus Lokiarchaeia archaeon]|nr:PIN domain-containing protein [Candidatus Lokiarchaeia archaeon]